MWDAIWLGKDYLRYNKLRGQCFFRTKEDWIDDKETEILFFDDQFSAEKMFFETYPWTKEEKHAVGINK